MATGAVSIKEHYFFFFASCSTRRHPNTQAQDAKQNEIILQLVNSEKAEIVLKTVQPKGRNLETMDRIEVDSSSYAKAGRNKSTVHEMISMH